MSPSTKNLKERTERVSEIISVLPGTSAEHGEIAAKVMNLLSSELSLAVKGLREAVEKANDEWVLKNGSSVRREILSSFDAKAKEILGESS